MQESVKKPPKTFKPKAPSGKDACGAGNMQLTQSKSGFGTVF